jgi:hypothetical protein
MEIKFNRDDCDVAYGEVLRSLRLTGVWCQAVGFVLLRLA